MKKRSITISGHSTSITLEDDFWDALHVLAQEEKLSISALLTKIDTERSTDNLSSAIRSYILKRLQQKLLQHTI